MMRRFGRKTLIAIFVILPTLLCWVTAIAVPAYWVHSDSPGGTEEPAVVETVKADHVSLILLGVGILNLAVWGRNLCRRESVKAGGGR